MIEIILMIGMFAAASTLIAKMFLSSERMSKEAQDYSQAVIQAGSIAERLKAAIPLKRC